VVVVIGASSIVPPLGSASCAVVKMAIVISSILGGRREPTAQDRTGKKQRSR
jgi:hypothetical protein